MTLVQLSYIVAVDTHRHFQRAAEACGVTQPTLSMQIIRLEEELGVQLFDRGQHPVAPTDLGELVIDQARVVLRESRRLRELVGEAGGDLRGELRVGVIPTLAPYLLPLFVSELTASHPGLSLVVEEAVTDQLIDLVISDRLDAALLATPVEARVLVERPLFEEPFVAYLSEGHHLFGESLLPVSALDSDDLWLLQEGHCFRDQVLRLCRDTSGPGIEPRPLHFESGNLEMLKRLVETSGGLTLLPALASLGLGASERARLHSFAAPVPTRQVRLVHGNGYLKRGLIEVFMGSLLAALPDECRRLGPNLANTVISRSSTNLVGGDASSGGA